MYAETSLKVQLDGCGRDDDIDLDVPNHPSLESAAEIDFSSCMQGTTYLVGKNAAAISSAAPPNANYSECLQAVEEEPESNRDGIHLERGLVVCIAHYDDKGIMRVFRVQIKQITGRRPTSIIVSALGWR